MYRKSRLLPETSSPEVFSQIHQWLDQCTTTHSFCGSGAETPLPTRVLDLAPTPTNSGSPTTVRLLEPPASFRAKYACLSHCWGGTVTDKAKTTRQTLGGMKTGIETHTLPKTFRDAVEIASRLGIRYLWIDSMCIVQDDPADWEREAKKMAAVYQNALVTIAATASSDSEGGCFSTPDPAFDTKQVDCEALDKTRFPLYFRATPPHFWDSSDLCPLLMRGWVYQERLLSPRYLHYTSTEVVWECSEHTTCYCSLYPIQMSGIQPPNPSAKLSHRYAMQEKSFTVLSDWWHGLVREFARLGLSFEKDRLFAVAGLATQFSAITSADGSSVLGEYVDGMWSNIMIEEISWEVFSKSKPQRQPAVKSAQRWRAPSWNWVSVCDPASVLGWTLREPSKARYAAVVDLSFVQHPMACQEFVRYNCVTLQAPVIEGVLRYLPGDGTVRVVLDRESISLSKSLGYLYTGDPFGDNTLEPDYDFTSQAGEGLVPDGARVRCVLMHGSKPGRDWVGLLTVSVDSQGEYWRRIGFVLEPRREREPRKLEEWPGTGSRDVIKII
jgi:hypothetical protein